jgi:two-component system, LuxR family, sensor kinase FixL
VLNLLAFAFIPASFAAVFCVAVYTWIGSVPAAQHPTATFNWLVGDLLALSSVTPFLLEFCIPAVRDFLGLLPVVDSSASTGRMPQSRAAATLENAALAFAFLFSLLFVFGWNPRANAHLFYLLFLPILWIAARRGVRRHRQGKRRQSFFAISARLGHQLR